MVESWHGWQEARLDAGPDGATLARVVIGDTAKVIDGELGSFLRARREAVRPVDVGLPEGPRRRTPGLRRAELATQAGISVEYLTRIEQGRDRRPSIQVLAALARVLRLGDDDLRHLQQLAVISGGTELLCQQAREAGRPVLRPTVRALLERLEPTPAYVVDHRLDLLAWTDGYERVARPCGLLDRDPPNLAWFTFADDRARAAFPDWAVMADEQVAALHELRRGDLEVDQLADRLTEVAGAEFRDRWASLPVGAPQTGTRTLAHPVEGELRLSFETLWLSDDGPRAALRLVVQLPTDIATSAALDRLAGRRPGGLRSAGAVTG